METFASALWGAIGLIIGLVIGYYKAAANMQDALKNYITRDDCAKCSVRTSIADASEDLRHGSKRFETISQDIALIKQYLEMKKG
jgi:hypothetical protein